FCSADSVPTELYTLSLHDALPILSGITSPGNNTKLRTGIMMSASAGSSGMVCAAAVAEPAPASAAALASFMSILLYMAVYRAPRSEEHTSELQSRGHLVCRLLLEK